MYKEVQLLEEIFKGLESKNAEVNCRIYIDGFCYFFNGAFFEGMNGSSLKTNLKNKPPKH